MIAMIMTHAHFATNPAEALILVRLSATVKTRAAAVCLMVFDVDGVLTDGSLYYGPQGEVLKRFHAQDGFGLRMLTENGITVALMSGRSSAIVDRRAADLGIADVMQGVQDKGAALSTLCQRHNLTLNQIGFMGDDIIDLPALQRVGFAASVPGAPPYIGQSVHWIATLPGGNGAARECCDVLLACQGRLSTPLTAPSSVRGGAIQ
jgi:3-deoxy-D-manno-octulosonate 8-phosphate phosphatase (KDO 8-P phosphatase)